MSAHAAYQAARRRARDKAGSREDRGLSHHSDGSGLADCPACEGAGEVYGDVHPYDDPADEAPEQCPRCNGAGNIPDGVRDPILDLRRARAMRRFSLVHRVTYGSIRQRVVSPVCLPPDPYADPLFRQAQAQADAEVAIRNFPGLKPAFDAIFGRAA